MKEAHAFVAPFESGGKMPFVAHTKLFEYASWGRPFIAPNLSIVKEHFPKRSGALLFEPSNIHSLTSAIKQLQQPAIRKKLQEEIASHAGKYSWTKRAHHLQDLLSL